MSTGVRIALCVATRDRHRALARSLRTQAPAARAAGALVWICDQTAEPFVPHPRHADAVRVLHRPDLAGLPAARNALIAAADAEVLLFLDDDSDIAGDAVRALAAAAAADPGTSGWGAVCETRARAQRRWYRLLRLGCLRDPRRLTGARSDAPSRLLPGCAMAFRRRALLAVRGFDARLPGYALGEDADACARLAAAGYRLRFLRGLRVHHRRDGANRAPPWRACRATLRFLRWFATRHGRHDPATPVHLALAGLAAVAAWAGAALRPLSAGSAPPAPRPGR